MPIPDPPYVTAAVHLTPEDSAHLQAAAAAAGMTLRAYLDSAFAAALARILHAADPESVPPAGDPPPPRRRARKYLNGRGRAP